MLLAVLALCILPVLISAGRVAWWSSGRTYDVDDVPARGVGMVLGARAQPHGPSAFLAARLDLAADLYEQGRIRAVLVTGDGRPEANDEPHIMRRHLEERGVPAGRIVEDPGGYDTYDSCIRARDVHGVTEMTVVTQGYHLGRAITICRALGIDAIGVGDTSMLRRYPYNYGKGWLREFPANLKMEWELLTRRPPERQDPPDPALLEATGG